MNKKVNLGCGKDYREGYINVDCDVLIKSDLVWNIEEKPLPTQWEYIFVSNLLEHLTEQGIKNIYDSLSIDGILEGQVPHYLSTHAYNDFTHKHYFNEMTLTKYPFTDFKVLEIKTEYRFSRYIKFTLPHVLVRLHENICPGVLPPTQITFKLKKEKQK